MDFDMWASLNALQKRQQAQQGAEASAEIAAEIRKLQAMIQEEANKPKCPWCGGGLEKGYEFCKHCSNKIVWVGNLVGKPEQEAQMRQEYGEYKHRQQLKAAKARRKKEKQKQELDRLKHEREQWEQTDEYAEWKAKRDLRKAKDKEWSFSDHVVYYVLVALMIGAVFGIKGCLFD